jgi:hypothetical protein
LWFSSLNSFAIEIGLGTTLGVVFIRSQVSHESPIRRDSARYIPFLNFYEYLATCMRINAGGDRANKVLLRGAVTLECYGFKGQILKE